MHFSGAVCDGAQTRHLVVVIDMSASMLDTDLRFDCIINHTLKRRSPTRFEHVAEQLRVFVPEYLDQNPLSSLALIGSRASKAHTLSRLGGARHAHVRHVGCEMKSTRRRCTSWRRTTSARASCPSSMRCRPPPNCSSSAIMLNA